VPITSAIGGAILVGSLVLLLVRPRRIPDWATAVGGGVLLVLVGVLPVGDALQQLATS
jgi:Na+/H+ antiporter NhaD/arsenite permease-like protein